MRQILPALALACTLGAAARPDDARPDPETLQLASVAGVVTALDTGEVLYRKHADLPVPIASVTKLMTALVVLESGQPLDEWLTIVDWHDDLEKNAYSRLRIGSEARRRELLRIALMSSENLATHVLAHHYPGGDTAFVAAMNARAEALGMRHAEFVDPAGLSPDNRATAGGLALLLKAAHAHPEIRDLSTRYQHTARFRSPRYTLPYGNTNPLVASSRWRVHLSKTGYLAEAGRCLVLVAEAAERTVGMVLLNSFGTRTPLGDAGRVRRWLTTGRGGTVAGTARDYERRTREQLLDRQGEVRAGSR
ncbi:MAG: D-alanyl-D-alanine endopeptidase [Pseudomonadota bacterium]